MKLFLPNNDGYRSVDHPELCRKCSDTLIRPNNSGQKDTRSTEQRQKEEESNIGDLDESPNAYFDVRLFYYKILSYQVQKSKHK